MKFNYFTTLLALVTVATPLISTAVPLGFAFTYQGRLSDDGLPANGIYDLRFGIYDSPADGASSGEPIAQDGVGVSNGLFTAQLDFGKAAFTGDARWLEISVRHSQGTNLHFTRLSPRQPLTATPHAVYALTADNANNAGSAASVAWAGVSGKPAGFADHIDNDTRYAPGTGLSLDGTNFSVNFGGDGSSPLAARSDHGHFGDYWVQNSTAFGLAINNNSANGLGFLARQGSGSGSGYGSPGLTAGLWGDSSAGNGVMGTSKDDIGVFGRATADSGVNYGVYGTTDSPAGFGVFGMGKGASGVAVKAGGSGIIQSTAKSYVFVPGSAMVNGYSSQTLNRYSTGAAVTLYAGGDIDNKIVTFPITLPGVLYGQEVTVKSVTIYYLCENGANNFITRTQLYKVVGADSSDPLIEDATDRTSNTASSYTLIPGGNNILSSTASFLSLTVTMTFADNASYIRIAGVRLELEHQ